MKQFGEDIRDYSSDALERHAAEMERQSEQQIRNLQESTRPRVRAVQSGSPLMSLAFLASGALGAYVGYRNGVPTGEPLAAAGGMVLGVLALSLARGAVLFFQAPLRMLVAAVIYLPIAAVVAAFGLFLIDPSVAQQFVAGIETFLIKLGAIDRRYFSA